jgi:hypothetical protein
MEVAEWLNSRPVESVSDAHSCGSIVERTSWFVYRRQGRSIGR